MKRLAKVPLVLSTIFIVIFAYTLLHEGGHAIVAMIFGGKITGFDINFITSYPHFTFDGDFTNAQTAFTSIAGPLVPLLVGYVIFFALRKSDSLLAKNTRLYTSILLIGTLIPNILLPVLNGIGIEMHNEDIVKFISYLSLNSFIVAFFVLVIILASGWFFFRDFSLKNIFTSNIKAEWSIKEKYLVIISVVLCTCLLVINIIQVTNNTTAFSPNPPANYSLVCSIKLDDKAYDNSIIYELNLDRPEIIDFYAWSSSKQNKNIKLVSENKIFGTKVKELSVLSGTGNQSYSNLALDKGHYIITLTAEKADAEAKLYLNRRQIPEEILSKTLLIGRGVIPEAPKGYTEIYKSNMLNSIKNKVAYEISLAEDIRIGFCAYTSSSKGKVSVVLISNNTDEYQILGDSSLMTEEYQVVLRKGKYKLFVNAADSDGELHIFMRDKF